jgi:hypothetical protein
MSHSQNKTSFQFTEDDENIKFSIDMPKEKFQRYVKMLWWPIGAGILWGISHVPLLPPHF